MRTCIHTHTLKRAILNNKAHNNYSCTFTYVCSNSCMYMYAYMHQSKTFHLKSVTCKSFQRIRRIANLSIRETFSSQTKENIYTTANC